MISEEYEDVEIRVYPVVVSLNQFLPPRDLQMPGNWLMYCNYFPSTQVDTGFFVLPINTVIVIDG
jgi:hypothetical protein